MLKGSEQCASPCTKTGIQNTQIYQVIWCFEIGDKNITGNWWL